MKRKERERDVCGRSGRKREKCNMIEKRGVSRLDTDSMGQIKETEIDQVTKETTEKKVKQKNAT